MRGPRPLGALACARALVRTRSRDAGVHSDGGAIQFDTDAVGEIADSEFSENVAASGGTTSRAGALSLWRSSSLTLIRCIVRQNTANLGGEVSESGGISLQQSSLVVVDSDLRGNLASRGGRLSRGGLMSLIAPSSADITGSALVDNHAALGAMQSLGGAVYAGAGASRLQLASSSVMRNLASGLGMAAGGALYSAQTVVIRIADCELSWNQADGNQAEGGAVWSAAESLHVTNVTFSSNTAVARGLDASALGGALFQHVLSATSFAFLEGCSITDNLARVAGHALRASGGALHCATGAIARLVGCVLQRNAAGGTGLLQSKPDWYASSIAEQLQSAAMHIYSGGSVLLDRCRMTERSQSTGVEHPMWYWIVAQGGQLTLLDSVFETSVSHFFDPCPFARDGRCNVNTVYYACPLDSDWEDCGGTPPPDAGPFGKLVHLRSLEADLVVRGSEVTNLTLKSASLVGAVNSTFNPPLQRAQAVQPASGSGTCAEELAGEPLCDPRATCEGVTNGGAGCTASALHAPTTRERTQRFPRWVRVVQAACLLVCLFVGVLVSCGRFRASRPRRARRPSATGTCSGTRACVGIYAAVCLLLRRPHSVPPCRCASECRQPRPPCRLRAHPVPRESPRPRRRPAQNERHRGSRK